MATIEVQIPVKAPVERIWEVISDIDNEPKFWKGTKEVRNIAKEGNSIKREITIAFRDQKCMQDITLYPKEKIEAVFTKGIISGQKTVSIISKNDEESILSTVWDIKLTGMMGMFTGMIKKHIKSGTEQAMKSIKEEIER